MSWIEIDDRFLEHPKFIRAVKLAGSDAVFLWVGIRAYCAQLLTDGFVPGDMIDEVRGPREPRKRAAALNALVDVNLVERVDGGFAMHDYLDWSKSRAQIEEQRAHGVIRSALRANTKLMREIRERDGNRCRYCGCAVDWRDRRGPRGGTYDHVVPLSRGGGAGIDNVVVACRQCNLSKHDKLLSEWGRTLLPVDYQVPTSNDLSPVLVSRARAGGEGSGSDQDQDLPEEIQGEAAPVPLTPVAAADRRWPAEEWFEGFRMCWLTYQQGSYGGRPNDFGAVADLREILSRLPLNESLAAQKRAPQMFAEFFSDRRDDIAEARHPWSWFVQRFDGLRFPKKAAPPDERCAFHRAYGTRGKLPRDGRGHDSCAECRHARAQAGERRGDPTPAADTLLVAADRKAAELRAAGEKSWTEEQLAEMRATLQRDRSPAKAVG